ncbi:hypothetical protein LTR56_023405 [Elasticomyces elasticus]|nr:hypothetical protein LTR56_023405 [Elasticomyces elasticus]KAK3622757.1 hypothetical protein LTR22_024672 [Elasticomyces elasticus]KAK4928242.1 hypothetical protein LTR49_004919 [Elasticomyces elasticus]KAK5742906.1 hypothetical protein LTS12_024057 [Elasticomyces elasticus]
MFDTLRSIGLENVFHVWPYRRSARKREDSKAIIEQSRKLALSRCAIHIFPICVSIVIITISNINIYLGRTLPGSIPSVAVNIALLQGAAKLQELLIVASTTAVVMDVLRYELLRGDGVPFGLLGSGFQFSELSFFWSPEFWGAMIYAPLTRRKRAILGGTLMIAGLVAVSAGPSCAILLVPRDQEWNAGGGTFYLPGTDDLLWPTNISLTTMAPLDDFCSWRNASSYATCPSGGYSELWSAFDEGGLAQNAPRDLDRTAARLSGHDTKVLIRSAPTDWTRLTTFAQMQLATRGVSYQTSAIGIHGPTTVVLTRLMNDWFNAALQIRYSPSRPSISEYKYWNTRQVKVNSRAPVVRVACSRAQNVSSSQSSVQFPVLPAYSPPTGTLGMSVPNLNRTMPGPIRTTWIPGAETSSAALVLESLWDHVSGTRAVLGCSVDARWADAEATFDGVTAWSTITTPCSNYWTHFCPVQGPTWSTISLDTEWLNLLTPFAAPTDPGEQDASTLENVLLKIGLTNDLESSTIEGTRVEQWNYVNDTSGLNRTTSVERVLALLVADGLSRYGTSLVQGLDNSGRSRSTLPNRGGWNQTSSYAHNLIHGRGAILHPPAGEYVAQDAKIQITGYTLMATDFTDYLAIAVLCLHIAIALAHTLVLMANGKSSGSWDTLAELLALLVNSPPAPVSLKNTCAGIRDLVTYSRIATVRAISPDADEGLAHAVLSFSEDERATTFRMAELPARPSLPYQTKLTSRPASHQSHVSALSTSTINDQTSMLCADRYGAFAAFDTEKQFVEVGRVYGDLGRCGSIGERRSLADV